MEPKLWWMNFAMGLELDIAGRFVYNAVRELHDSERLDEGGSSFEIVYGLSVGVERLQKAAIVLWEASATQSSEEVEESLKGHSTLAFHERLEKHRPQCLAPIHKEFLGLLTEFYATQRYGRYSQSVRDVQSEHASLRRFIAKHLNLDATPGESMPNSPQIRKFLGNVVRTITRALYETVQERARQLNIYTYELSSDSKASKVRPTRTWSSGLRSTTRNPRSICCGRPFRAVSIRLSICNGLGRPRCTPSKPRSRNQAPYSTTIRAFLMRTPELSISKTIKSSFLTFRTSRTSGGSETRNCGSTRRRVDSGPTRRGNTKGIGAAPISWTGGNP